MHDENSSKNTGDKSKYLYIDIILLQQYYSLLQLLDVFKVGKLFKTRSYFQSKNDKH